MAVRVKCRIDAEGHLRSRAVTYAVEVFISRKWWKIVLPLLQTSNRKCCCFYYISVCFAFITNRRLINRFVNCDTFFCDHLMLLNLRRFVMLNLRSCDNIRADKHFWTSASLLCVLYSKIDTQNLNKHTYCVCLNDTVFVHSISLFLTSDSVCLYH